MRQNNTKEHKGQNNTKQERYWGMIKIRHKKTMDKIALKRRYIWRCKKIRQKNTKSTEIEY
jgi:hypothetical protein